MSERSPAALIKQGLTSGLAFGLAVTIVHLVIGIVLIVRLGMPPLTWFSFKSVPYELVLAAVAGLALCPIFLSSSRHARWLHSGGMAVVWLAMERWVAVDPSKPLMWIAPTLVGLVLLAIGRKLSARSAVAGPGVGAALVGLALCAPIVASIIRGDVIDDPDRGEARTGAPDVVMIVMDTTRTMSMSTYGYERETTPNFTAFADGGLLFEDPTAPATWSLPAHAALFTGTFPSFNNAHGEHRYLGPDLPTVAEVFAGAGWETRAFTANPHIADSFGLTRGFAWTDQAWITGTSGRAFSFIYRFLDTLGFGSDDKGGGQVVTNINNWLDNRPDDAPPAFVFVNFLEAHFPFHQLPKQFREAYQDRPISELREAGQITFGVQFGRQLTEEEYAQIHQPITDLYDGGVLYTDYLVGQVLDAWKGRGTYDDTIFVILGDHGEMVGEHGSFGHVTSVYDQDLRVPLAFRYPKKIKPGSRVPRAVSTLGTMATLLTLADVEVPDTVHMGSLLPALDPENTTAGIPIISERYEEHMLSARFAEGTANGEGPLVNPRGRFRIYRQDNWKFVQHSGGGKWLFDLEADPGEMQDMARSFGNEVERLEGEVKLWQAKHKLPALSAEVAAGDVPEMSAEEEAALRALGYIE